MGYRIAAFSQNADGLGEGPLWSAEEETLYWIDVTERRLRRRHLLGPEESTPLERMPGALALRRDGGLLLTSRNGLAFLSQFGAPALPIVQHVIDFGHERINDGAPDPAGRYWFGTLTPAFNPGGAALYRLDPDLTLHRMAGDITLSNGIAWSPDGRTMYFTDSRPGCIYRCAYNEVTGEIGRREIYVAYEGTGGRPDGCAMDAAGHLWVAEIDGSRIARYAPDGSLAATIPLPIRKPTSLAFGGPSLDTLFVTSMSYSLDDAERATQPLAGRVLSVEVEVPGLPRPRFAG